MGPEVRGSLLRVVLSVPTASLRTDMTARHCAKIVAVALGVLLGLLWADYTRPLAQPAPEGAFGRYPIPQAVYMTGEAFSVRGTILSAQPVDEDTIYLELRGPWGAVVIAGDSDVEFMKRLDDAKGTRVRLTVEGLEVGER